MKEPTHIEDTVYKADNQRIVGIRVVPTGGSYDIGLYVGANGGTVNFDNPKNFRKSLTYYGMLALLEAEIQKVSNGKTNPEEAFSKLEVFVYEHNLAYEAHKDPSGMNTPPPEEIDESLILSPDDWHS